MLNHVLVRRALGAAVRTTPGQKALAAAVASDLAAESLSEEDAQLVLEAAGLHGATTADLTSLAMYGGAKARLEQLALDPEADVPGTINAVASSLLDGVEAGVGSAYAGGLRALLRLACERWPEETADVVDRGRQLGLLDDA